VEVVRTGLCYVHRTLGGNIDDEVVHSAKRELAAVRYRMRAALIDLRGTTDLAMLLGQLDS